MNKFKQKIMEYFLEKSKILKKSNPAHARWRDDVHVQCNVRTSTKLLFYFSQKGSKPPKAKSKSLRKTTIL